MGPLAHFVLLVFRQPGHGALWPVAVLLLDPANDRLHVRGKENYASIAHADDAFVLAETVKQLQADASAQSGSAILDLLESTLSNSLTMTVRIMMRVKDVGSTLDHLSAAFLL